MGEWFTVEGAAKWLADHLGIRNYSVDELWRAIQKDTLQAHYWPLDAAELGVFSWADGDTCSGSEAEFGHIPIDAPQLIARFSGPVPIASYNAFSVGKALANEPDFMGDGPLGISLYESGRPKPLGACYVINESGQPSSLTEREFVVLIHSDNLLSYSNSKEPKPHASPYIELIRYNASGLELEQWTANCAQTGGGNPFTESDDPTPQDQYEPLLKALAMAAHVIAELGEKLDGMERQRGRHLNLKIDGKPNVRGIAMQLSEQARRLNHTGYGSGHRGFEERLRAALKAID